MNRLGLKISCLVAALIIWMQVASTSTVVQDVSLPVRISGLAQGLTLAGSDIPTHVHVKLSGSKLRLLGHRFFNHFVGEVRLDLAGREPGPVFPLDIKSSDVFTTMPEATVYPPARARVHIDRLDTLKVPVRLQLEGGLPQGKGLLKPAYAEPGSVTVSGPRRLLKSPPVVVAGSVDLARVSSSTRRLVMATSEVSLLNVEPSKIEVVLEVGTLAERTLANVPVIALIDTGRPEAGVSPPVADVKVRGVADSIAALTRDRLLVTLPVGDRPEGVYTIPGQVTHPVWLQILGIVPPDFRVIVGDPALPSRGLEGTTEDAGG